MSISFFFFLRCISSTETCFKIFQSSGMPPKYFVPVLGCFKNRNVLEMEVFFCASKAVDKNPKWYRNITNLSPFQMTTKFNIFMKHHLFWQKNEISKSDNFDLRAEKEQGTETVSLKRIKLKESFLPSNSMLQ